MTLTTPVCHKRLELADKILTSVVLKRWLLQQRETEASFVFYNWY